MRALFVYKNHATKWGEVHCYLPIYQEEERLGTIEGKIAYSDGEPPNRNLVIKRRLFTGYQLKNFIVYEEE